MSPRIPIIIALLSFSLNGCVAALPLATQLISSPEARAHLCSLAKMPGQTISLCDRISLAPSTPAAERVTQR